MTNAAWKIGVSPRAIELSRRICLGHGDDGLLVSPDAALPVVERAMQQLLFHPVQEGLWHRTEVYKLILEQIKSRFGYLRSEYRGPPRVDLDRLVDVADEVDRGRIGFDPSILLNSCDGTVDERTRRTLLGLPRTRMPAVCSQFAYLSAVFMVALTEQDALVFDRLGTVLNKTARTHSLCGIETPGGLQLFDFSIYRSLQTRLIDQDPKNLTVGTFVDFQQQQSPVSRIFDQDGPREISRGIDMPDRNSVRLTLGHKGVTE